VRWLATGLLSDGEIGRTHHDIQEITEIAVDKTEIHDVTGSWPHFYNVLLSHLHSLLFWDNELSGILEHVRECNMCKEIDYTTERILSGKIVYW